MSAPLERVLLVTDDMALYGFAQPLLTMLEHEGRRLVAGGLTHVRTTEEAEQAHFGGAGPFQLILVDANVRRSAGEAPAPEGRDALEFFRILLHSTHNAPAIALLAHSIETFAKISQLCASHAARLLEELTADSLLDTILQVRGGARPAPWEPARSAVTIEVELRNNITKFWTVREHGRKSQEREFPIRNPHRLRRTAKFHRTWNVFVREKEGRAILYPGWQREIETAGIEAYEQIVKGCISEQLLGDLRQASGDWSQVHMRVHIQDQDLFAFPFETMFDEANEQFVRLYQPLVRKLCRSTTREVSAGLRGAPQRVLFVEAQVEGQLTLIDDAGAAVKQAMFEPLRNIKLERDYFNAVWGSSKRLTVVASETGSGESFSRQLERTLREQGPFDLVHFAGHSFTTEDERTYLVLPTADRLRVVGLPIGAFAKWAGDAKARFVYLSSCRGSSAETVRLMAEEGIPSVLGFRWDVEDDRAAEFAKRFYDALLGKPQLLPIGRAYHKACRDLYDAPNGRSSPIWAAPLLVMQGDDWWQEQAA